MQHTGLGIGINISLQVFFVYFFFSEKVFFPSLIFFRSVFFRILLIRSTAESRGSASGSFIAQHQKRRGQESRLFRTPLASFDLFNGV